MMKYIFPTRNDLYGQAQGQMHAASRRFYLDSNPEPFMSPKLWQSLSAVLETLVGSNRYQVKIRRLEPRK